MIYCYFFQKMYILYFGFFSCLLYLFQIQNTLLVCDVINSSYANFVEEITMLYQRKNWLQVWLTDNKLTKVTLLKQSKLLGPFQLAETYPLAQMHHIGCRFGDPPFYILHTLKVGLHYDGKLEHIYITRQYPLNWRSSE